MFNVFYTFVAGDYTPTRVHAPILITILFLKEKGRKWISQTAHLYASDKEISAFLGNFRLFVISQTILPLSEISKNNLRFPSNSQRSPLNSQRHLRQEISDR